MYIKKMQFSKRAISHSLIRKAIKVDLYLFSLKVVHEAVMFHFGPTLLPVLAKLIRFEAEDVSGADGRVT